MTQRKVAQPDLIDLLLADYKKPEGTIGSQAGPQGGRGRSVGVLAFGNGV